MRGMTGRFLIGSDNSIQRLKTGGLMIGLIEQAEYEDERIAMQVGDLLVIQSDGISEAMNSNQEQFGEERLQALFSSKRIDLPKKLSMRW